MKNKIASTIFITFLMFFSSCQSTSKSESISQKAMDNFSKLMKMFDDMSIKCDAFLSEKDCKKVVNFFTNEAIELHINALKTGTKQSGEPFSDAEIKMLYQISSDLVSIFSETKEINVNDLSDRLMSEFSKMDIVEKQVK